MRLEHVTSKCDKALKLYENSNLSLRQLSEKLNINRGLLSGYFLGKGVDIYSRKSKINDSLFKKIDNEEKAYWLGFLYADGCVSYNSIKNINRIELTLKASDKAHLEKFKKFLNYTGAIKFRKTQNAHRVMFACKRMCEDLIDLGCVPNKSLILKFPTTEQLPSKYINHFVRGYFDGDGCISKSSKSIAIGISVLGTFEFIEKLCDLYNFPKERVIKKDKRHTNNTYTLILRTLEGLTFLQALYADSTIYLERKKQRFDIAVSQRNL